MAISFNDIPNNLRVPLTYIEFDNTKAVSGTPAMPYKILLLGQSTLGSHSWSEPKRFTRLEAADAECGEGSQLALMLRAALSVAPNVEVWGCAVQGLPERPPYIHSIKFAGTATEDGNISITIGTETKTVWVANGDDAQTVAALVANAVESIAQCPVFVMVDDDTVNISPKWIDLTSLELVVAASTDIDGLTLTASTNTAPNANSDVQDAIDVMGDDWWNMIVCPWSDDDNMQAIKTEMLSRFGPMRMADGVVFTASNDTPTTNDFLRTHLDTTNCASLSFVVAATNAAVAAKSLSIDPARPLQTLALPGIKAAGLASRDLKAERNIKLHEGVSTTFVDAGGNVCIERQITTYTTNALGAEDPSYLDVNTLATLAYLRYSTRTRINLRFPRHKLADDGTIVAPGQAMVTPSIIKAELVALAGEWAEMGLIEDLAGFKDSLIVERNANDRNRVDVLASPNLVNQLRIFAEQIQFIL